MTSPEIGWSNPFRLALVGSCAMLVLEAILFDRSAGSVFGAALGVVAIVTVFGALARIDGPLEPRTAAIACGVLLASFLAAALWLTA